MFGTMNELIIAERRINELEEENARLRDALLLIANNTPEPGSALETVVKFATLALEATNEQ